MIPEMKPEEFLAELAALDGLTLEQYTALGLYAVRCDHCPRPETCCGWQLMHRSPAVQEAVEIWLRAIAAEMAAACTS